MTADNREKFIQIAERYGQPLKFYNVEELCANRIAEIVKYLPQAKESLYTIAMFYRFFIPDLLLPQGIEKAFYLDSDIIVNCDIAEFWQIDLGDKPFGAVSRASQIKDKANDNTSKVFALVREGLVNAEDYFNSAVLLMNLKVLREKENAILEGLKFISGNRQYYCLDQDVLNYCFSTSYLKLPAKFNCVMLFEREWTIEKKIYHYAANRITLGMDMNDPCNRLWMDYFIKTPWIDDDAKAVLSGTKLPSRKNFAVSVVIPMYNVEEFIGECLDSLLIQTFQDFEVIVVDDCSTDNSCAIVESYAPKFNGRLRLEQTEKNSGGGGYVPRNIGLMLARGEYIQFLDADDMLLPTALESLYLAANLYDAEVVYTSSIYYWNEPNDIYLHKDSTTKKMPKVQTEFTIDNPNKNLSRLLLEPGEGNFRACWSKFVQRDFLIKNKIFFPNFYCSADYIWCIKLYCRAKRFLRISTPLYFYRRFNSHSIIRTIREPKEQLSPWFSDFSGFAKHLYELERDNEVLSENPLYCLMALKGSFNWILNRTEYARKELDSAEIYKILRDEFVKSSDDSAALLPFFVSLVNDKMNEKISTDYYVKPINKFKNHITSRIDIKLNSAEGDFQIVSVSDDKAMVQKPIWFQKNGVGYQIQSYVGNLEFVAKSSVDGKISLSLRGIDIRTPEDKSKCIPYWIDYTKLTVNGEIIFDTLTPAWHDKSYRYNIDAKADEEIKIQVEWLPHRNDTVETPTPEVTAPESKVATPSKPDNVKPKIETAPEVTEPAPKIPATSKPDTVESAVEPESKIEPTSKPDNVESTLEPQSTIEPTSKIDNVESTVESQSTIEPTSKSDNVESTVEPESTIEPTSKSDTVESTVEPESTIEPTSKTENVESAVEPQSTIEPTSKTDTVESAVEPQSTIEPTSKTDIVESTVEPESTIEPTSKPDTVESDVEPQSTIVPTSKIDTVESTVESQSTIEPTSKPDTVESAVEPESIIEPTSKIDNVESKIEPQSKIEPTSKIDNVESAVEPESIIEPTSKTDTVESAVELQSTIKPTSKTDIVESTVEPESTIEPTSKPDTVESDVEPQSTIEPTSKTDIVESTVEPQSTIEPTSKIDNVESTLEPESIIEPTSQTDKVGSAVETELTIE